MTIADCLLLGQSDSRLDFYDNSGPSPLTDQKSLIVDALLWFGTSDIANQTIFIKCIADIAAHALRRRWSFPNKRNDELNSVGPLYQSLLLARGLSFVMFFDPLVFHKIVP